MRCPGSSHSLREYCQQRFAAAKLLFLLQLAFIDTFWLRPKLSTAVQNAFSTEAVRTSVPALLSAALERLRYVHNLCIARLFSCEPFCYRSPYIRVVLKQRVAK